jgi:hypothetical protein
MVCADSTPEKPTVMSSSSGVRSPPLRSGSVLDPPVMEQHRELARPEVEKRGAFRGIRCSGRFSGSARRSGPSPTPPSPSDSDTPSEVPKRG